ncbi:ABC-type proline/glycine betaine transport systems, substrate-binding protein [Secundilactobacillus oryzae JCM 18671]|uniref:ABC-type proline/glycine betaine transport systems, substrate-binding protein n=1 Tax=Secundilactobacillus oryzae JCM 18671 TaxID=1291743 RepID=A0A081BFW2_9LACO|nr:ABC-type proline/glycine betaine transport systems, substrate-binding protein [Secundilactobacillus oryzae JCM 18671]
MKILKSLFKLLVLPLSLLLILSGCGFPGLGGNEKQTIKVASMSTTEQQIMAYMMKGLIEHDSNLKVEIINNLGSAAVTLNAMKRGDADISAIRYNGTDLTTVLGNNAEKDPAVVTKKVEQEFNDRYQMHYFKNYGFADTYAFMVTQEYAKKHNLKTVSDLKKIAPKMTVGIDQIWMNRKGDGYPGFKEQYNISFGKVYPMQIGLVYDALQAGKMDAVLGYSTDGRIGSYDLKILKDDKQFFPPYDASPVATNAILKKHPELRPIIQRMVGKISLKTMQRLNYEVDDGLAEPQAVANEYLKQHNYFEGSDK